LGGKKSSIEESIEFYGPGDQETVLFQYNLKKVPNGECLLKTKVVDLLKMDSVEKSIEFQLK